MKIAKLGPVRLHPHYMVRFIQRACAVRVPCDAALRDRVLRLVGFLEFRQVAPSERQAPRPEPRKNAIPLPADRQEQGYRRSGSAPTQIRSQYKPMPRPASAAHSPIVTRLVLHILFESARLRVLSVCWQIENQRTPAPSGQQEQRANNR